MSDVNANIETKEISHYIYYQLVKNNKDLAGMVAYSFYKTDKINFIISYQNTNNNIDPPHDKLDLYQKSLCNEKAINSYLEKANGLIASTINFVIEGKTKELINVEKKLNEREEKLDKKIKKIDDSEKESKIKNKNLNIRDKHCNVVQKHGYLYGVGQSMVAAIFMILITMLIFMYSAMPSDIGGYLTQKIKNGQANSQVK